MGTAQSAADTLSQPEANRPEGRRTDPGRPETATPIRALLLEDRATDAELIALELRRAGLRADWMRADDEEGYRRLLDAAPDVILADFSLPQFSALAALDLLRERGSDVPLIVVSGAMSDEEAVECMRRGAADYLIKDRLGRLGFAVRRALADRQARIERRLAEEQRAQLRLEQAARAREQERSARLRDLADASVSISANLTVDVLLDTITERARGIVGAHQAITSLTVDRDLSQSITAVSLSNAFAPWATYDAPIDGTGIYRLVCAENRTYRLTQAELEAHPAWRGFGTEAGRHPPMRGWLAAPLVGRDGGNLGMIQLSDKTDGGDFDEDDEAVLVQLARLASVALENAQLYQQAQEAVRARDEFLSIASHELRNPIAGIKGTAQLFRRFHRQGRLDEARLVRYLDTIESTADRLASLTEDLLDVSRLQHGQLSLRPRSTDLAELVRATVSRHQLHAERHRFALAVPDEPLVHVADPDRIEQIVTNVLSNAVKYSPDGGVIEIELARHDGGARLRVRDSGIGVPPEVTERIFEPFGRAENAAVRNIPGLGLGLYICRRIAEQHGGRLWAESAGEGAGTTFSLWLPATPEPPATAPPPFPPSSLQHRAPDRTAPDV